MLQLWNHPALRATPPNLGEELPGSVKNMKMPNAESLSLVDAAAAIQSGMLSSTEYVRALFARMDQVEPRVQAWVTVDREAVLAEARKCDAEAAAKRIRGPLHGVPIGVKDIFYTKGMRTTMGATPFQNFVPDCDADVVIKLKQAGALILGKTVTTVFVFLDPGPTRNPWNLEHTPGGSSSGSAAAVAARMCPGAIGSQTVGSVGRPAAYNGVVSLMPTQSRVSLKNVFPLSWPLDHAGIFGRSVADVELQLAAIAESPVERSNLKRPIRIGVIRDFFYDNAEPEARSLQDAFVSKLSNSPGFQVDEAKLPSAFALSQPILRTILRADVAAIHEDLFPAHPTAYGPKLRELVETGMLINARDYLHARRLRRHYQREMTKLFEKFDVLLTPAAPGPAPAGIEATGSAVMNGPWTLADFPTVTLPFGLAANGLPLGIQLSGPSLDDGALIEAASAIESVTAFKEISCPLT
jgi:aspartyl-tRNA(Asn)/glutamyl-tRNA(Gln) amidotransferase subunit A